MSEKDLFGDKALFSWLLSARKKENKKPLTWQAFVEKISNDLDERIIAHAKEEGLLYIGGKCHFTATKANEKSEDYILNVDAELYYKDQFKMENGFQIYPLHTDKRFEAFDLDDEETKNQLEKLKSEQYEFNVETPKN